jgi:hypothetical protein
MGCGVAGGGGCSWELGVFGWVGCWFASDSYAGGDGDSDAYSFGYPDDYAGAGG